MPSISGGISILIAATESITGSGDLSITTSATYAGSQNRLTSVTDAAGNVVKYGYGDAHSQMLGLPTAVTDPAGTKTLYSYDDLGRTTETSIANKAKVAYTYGSGDLEKVQRTDIPNTKTQTYNFTYDAFGNMKTAKVGTRLLASYDYFTGNGQLETLTYGNGADVDYTYDDLGRTKTAEYSDGRKLTYAYNGEGQLHSITDTGTGSTWSCRRYG